MTPQEREEKRNKEEQERIAAYPKGTVVRVKDPEGYIASMASKLRDRLGEVTGHTIPYGNPLVCFHAVGRRSELRQSYSFGSVSDLQIVTDTDLITAWREEVKQTAERAAARVQKKTLAVKKTSYKAA